MEHSGFMDLDWFNDVNVWDICFHSDKLSKLMINVTETLFNSVGFGHSDSRVCGIQSIGMKKMHQVL